MQNEDTKTPVDDFYNHLGLAKEAWKKMKNDEVDKFIFILPKKQHKFLEWLAVKEGVSKATIVRRLINDLYKKHKNEPKS